MVASGEAASIRVGTYQGKSGGKNSNVPRIRLVCDAPELESHMDKPWLRDWIAERHGASEEDGADERQQRTHASPTSGDAVAVEESLRRHTLICGSAGSGKSRLALHLATRRKARIQEISGSASQEQHGSEIIATAGEHRRTSTTTAQSRKTKPQAPTTKARRPAIVAPVSFAEVDDSA